MPLYGSAKDPSLTVAGIPTDVTDSSGGTPSDTIAAAGGAYNQGNENDFRASVAAKLDQIITLLNQMSEGRKLG